MYEIYFGTLLFLHFHVGYENMCKNNYIIDFIYSHNFEKIINTFCENV